MRKDRTSKDPQVPSNNKVATSGSPDFPIAILDEASKVFAFEVSSVQIAASGAIFLVGWTDDRSSKLRQVHLKGQSWSKVIDGRHIGRHRRPDVEGSSITAHERFFGFWLLAAHDRNLINGDRCFVELVLTNGMSRSVEVPIEFTPMEELRTRFAKFWGDLKESDRVPPTEITHLEQALKVPRAEAIMPKHNVESVVIAEEGGVFVNGWIDDTTEKFEAVRVGANDLDATFGAPALARTYRNDVQQALATPRRHEFGFWGLAANESVKNPGNVARVDFMMTNGARQRHEISIRNVDQDELRNVALTYLASSQHLGNPQLESVAKLDNYIGNQIVDLNLRISRKIVSQPYVERFSRRSKRYKGSIVICLYGKPEYLFLQNSLFSNRPGIEDYEFIYVCNSPELAEPLLRDAHIAASAYDIDQTIIVLPGNAGFGAANNAAANLAQTDRILIMNPDVFPFDQDWAAKHTDVVEQLPHEQTNIFGVPLYYDDGSLMHGGMYFAADRGISIEQTAFKSMMSLRVEHFGKGAPPLTDKFVRSRPVPAVTGAFMSLDRSWFEGLDGFSEEYVFGHYEDADLCLKSQKRGIVPWIHDVKLWHLEGKGSFRLPVHEGASIVNRWLFNKRWSEMVIPEMLGQSPNLGIELATNEVQESPPQQGRLNGERLMKKGRPKELNIARAQHGMPANRID